ncbi:zinc ribbon domain-containing protein [Myxococcota bacterium]
MHARFYLAVEVARVADVQAYFHEKWQEGLEIEGAMLQRGQPETTADEPMEGACPACGTGMPDDAAECPECGLFLGNPDAG